MSDDGPIDSKHPIDEMEDDLKKVNAEAEKQAFIDSSLIYQVFGTPAGSLLLEKWTTTLIDVPTASIGMDLLGIGINEGQKNFIRMIRSSIKLCEEKP